ncbi:PAS domain-containing hybrid sensor histidine kinase/response regulator [Hyunsoonleella ulvae]|uniref:PAS domain-containing hybrid sensor histidine kinase/response regulator n=1 Tax=Hyunsoonleella ulvae TaxID=2799948 RepID=UPI00193A4571|nr:PAS domain-containing hybrid sensor histidine kinase/response regulator [Hyunsoonleella ulvae]
MLNKEHHRLLRRQLKRVDKELLENPKFTEFLNVVNDSYRSFDKDILHIENILELSSKELYTLNQKLIRERDHTKSRLKNLVNNIGGIIFETDVDGNFTFLNNAWAVYSGYSIEESIGKNYKDFLIKEHIESSVKVDKLFSRENKYIKFIFHHKNKDDLRWFELKSKALNDENNTTIGFIGTITDITNLKETQIELQKASKSKDEFLSTMSHEIRTPLNAVTGLANILLMEDYLPEQADHLKALKYSGEHLLGLINDLLDFNKIKSGKLKLVEKDFSLSYLLENLKSHFGLRTEKKGIVFNVVKANDIPNNIIGDKLKLTQVIKNLLSNSLKFTEKGSIILSVKNLGIIRNKVLLEFKVKDTGIGISKDRQESIFESFMQATTDTSIKYGGTGLGLSISKKLLELQNSDLIVESEEGKGSTFSFQVSYRVSNRLNTFEPDMIKMQPVYKPLDVNVLVAEDNKMNVLILKRFFLKWQVNYVIAEHGEQVLDYFKAPDFNFDLVLMDLQMPILDGYKTTRIIRNMEDTVKANVPIIALTAFAQTDIKEKTQRYGMSGFMSKPFNPEKLYKTLQSYSKTNFKKNIG